MIIEDLGDGWHLGWVAGPVPDSLQGERVPAIIPGSVHTDLLRAGLIPDPYVGMGEAELEWMHRTTWRYETTFTSSAVAGGERLDLVFDGLDTVARIELNGELVGETANQHRSYRFDVGALVRDGANTLAVTFSSALEYAEQIQEQIGSRPRAYHHPMNAVRKMAASFGWDWGPDLQTAGIWKPVRLERWTTARLAQVRPLVTLDDDGTGHVEAHVDLEKAAAAAAAGLRLEATLRSLDGDGDGNSDGNGDAGMKGRTPLVHGTTAVDPGTGSSVVSLELPDAPVWWPAGYGEHPLVQLTVSLLGPGDIVLGTYSKRVGFRQIEIDTTPDDVGTPFTIKVNGQPIFVKGANWIPNDHLLTRITRDGLAERVDQALGAHMNMLRVWGGGIYESEDFYDVCDERGIMVWQDFLLACAAYGEDEPLWSEFEAEARENVARLTPHASLVLWNGGNENLWGFMDWKWQEELEGRSWGLGYYTRLFPEIVAELDPTRPYIPGSPFSPGFTEQLSSGTSPVHPNDQNHGPRHEWEVWNRLDFTTYRDNIPRFCSEFGFQGPPTWATLTRAVPTEALNKTSPEFLLHQKAADGNAKLDFGLAGHLTIPEDFGEWHWATQLLQARAVAFGIEHFRSYWPRTAGSLIWQLNDCWPVTSWSAVDGDGREKPLLHALRHAYAPRILTVQPRGEDTCVVVVNDHAEAWAGDLELVRRDFEGTAIGDETVVSVDVAPRSVLEVIVPRDLVPADGVAQVLVATLGEARTVHTDAPWSALPGPDGALDARVETVRGGYVVHVRANLFVRDVTLVVDRADPDTFVDDALITLLPGEEHTFSVSSSAELDPEVLAGTLRSATRLS